MLLLPYMLHYYWNYDHDFAMTLTMTLTTTIYYHPIATSVSFFSIRADDSYEEIDNRTDDRVNNQNPYRQTPSTDTGMKLDS